jgi:hypothetical protein
LSRARSAASRWLRRAAVGIEPVLVAITVPIAVPVSCGSPTLVGQEAVVLVGEVTVVVRPVTDGWLE